ncbi:helix-turn-helix domain-containing protein [Vibrio sp. SCSIO 43140]|uniref:helix-turn-helix domain-containing protein n=1 Tax=Vibrio sp. SCSIO 43140 TaxID=2819100 RepID=UPI00207518F7|nr:helix-turn-helix domain-containing protein [Vibrio sp. SCSIO 43140]USD63367.1 helix-turn-helix domain-containing protein [Vibrio sp. SCSIO 43140]
MSKHHRAFKLKLAKYAQHEGSRALDLKFGVSSDQIRYWVSVYQIHGENSFRHEQAPYSQDFKLEVLKTMRINNWSLRYTSAYFDLSSPGILFQWQKLYAQQGISRLKPQKKGRPCMTNHSLKPKPSEQMTEKELREELEYLRAENAVLKKLEALAQAKKEKAKQRHS